MGRRRGAILARWSPIDVVLPVLLTVAWSATWLGRRQLRLWFFPVAAALSVVCFAIFLGSNEPCTPQDAYMCRFDIAGWEWATRGLLGIVTTFVLGVVTITVEIGLALRRRTSPPTA